MSVRKKKEEEEEISRLPNLSLKNGKWGIDVQQHHQQSISLEQKRKKQKQKKKTSRLASRFTRAMAMAMMRLVDFVARG